MTSAASAARAPGAELLDYDDVIARYEPVLGLEVHVELSTATKMFCGCATAFGAEPNTQVCPVCLGLPGSLPVLNEAAVESAIRIGLALNCEIVSWCRFARKNYFYPDMPKNYQISQYDEPIAINGYLDVPIEDGSSWRVEIERAHMEEDTGKLTHLGSETGRIHGATTSLIDYNRAGVPLIEIVTKPIEGAGERAPEIARAYVTALRDLLRALGVSDVRMDQGSMRCDSNVSLKPIGVTEFGTRSETKNVNSLKSDGRALFWSLADGSSRRPGTFTRTATPARAAPRKPLRTIATSPNPTWSRSRPAPTSLSGYVIPFPNYRGCAAIGFSRTGVFPTR
jgi:aspartyl-tRNA(Asn)/glutamyl-tRNA(Gln) amidotransferase subunit B